jgi:hypothetical protein
MESIERELLSIASDQKPTSWLARLFRQALHGLVAGDVKGLGEPALALTMPAKATELDDGLLTASEVAQLKLNADWVVLSACNPGRAGGPPMDQRAEP